MGGARAGLSVGEAGSGYLKLLEEAAVVSIGHGHIVIFALLLVQ